MTRRAFSINDRLNIFIISGRVGGDCVVGVGECVGGGGGVGVLGGAGGGVGVVGVLGRGVVLTAAEDGGRGQEGEGQGEDDAKARMGGLGVLVWVRGFCKIHVHLHRTGYPCEPLVGRKDLSTWEGCNKRFWWGVGVGWWRRGIGRFVGGSACDAFDTF